MHTSRGLDDSERIRKPFVWLMHLIVVRCSAFFGDYFQLPAYALDHASRPPTNSQPALLLRSFLRNLVHVLTLSAVKTRLILYCVNSGLNVMGHCHQANHHALARGSTGCASSARRTCRWI